MSNRKILLVTVAMLGLLASRAALAWNSIGHMTVAYVAYQQLTPAEKARVSALLQLNPYYSKWVAMVPSGATEEEKNLDIFMMAATWPDEIKAEGSGYTGNDNPPHDEPVSLNTGYSDKGAHKYWHFVNTPFGTGGINLPEMDGPNVLEKVALFRAALASDAPDAVKSYDLVWLEHLVGDVHQPLHCSNRITTAKPHGDLGGNLVVVSGPAKELHAFWDGALGEGETKNFSVSAKVGPTLPAADPDLVKDDNIDDWAAESFSLAKTSVYVTPIGDGLGPYTPTADYTAATRKIAEQRVALAGARLANLLKASLQCGETTCAH